jgi:hypothetical protein
MHSGWNDLRVFLWAITLKVAPPPSTFGHPFLAAPFGGNRRTPAPGGAGHTCDVLLLVFANANRSVQKADHLAPTD